MNQQNIIPWQNNDYLLFGRIKAIFITYIFIFYNHSLYVTLPDMIYSNSSILSASQEPGTWLKKLIFSSVWSEIVAVWFALIRNWTGHNIFDKKGNKTLFKKFNSIFNKQFSRVPEHNEGESHKKTEGSTKFRYERC